jgi:O-antigen/teichoic acid export membrane protein
VSDTAASTQLDRALVSGMAWTAVMRWSSQLVSWAATFYAARLLAPSDYGIVGMATLAIGFARMVEDFGLDSIFIQDRSIGGERQAALAGFIVGIGVLFCLIFIAISIPVAQFFKEPHVVWAVCGLSLLCITDALQVVPRALIQRELKFGALAAVSFGQMVVTQATLVTSALLGFGFKALVFNSLAGGVFGVAVLYYLRPYSIAWPRNIPALARPLLQGWRVVASRIAYYLYTSADQWIIGRMLGKDALGSYQFATTLSTTAVQEVGSVVSKVVPGIFSAAQERRDELRRYYLVLTELVAYLTLPMSIGIGLTADLIVGFLLGPQWSAVVAPLRILCIYVAFSNSQMLVSHLMVWTGQFRAQMWCTIVTTAFLPLSFFIGVKFGLQGIAWMWAVVYPLTNIPAIIIGFRTISIKVIDWLRALWPALASCALMCAAVVGVRTQLHTPDMRIELAVAIGTGVFVYAAALGLLFRNRLRAMVDIIRHAKNGQQVNSAAPSTA